MIRLDDYIVGLETDIDINQILDDAQPSMITVLVDEITAVYCLPILLEQLSLPVEVITIPSGEAYKNIDSCNKVWSEMISLGMDRHSILINLGGGVIGDLGGFCAASFMRGIKFIHIPTTLLSMVDSSIGGKVGVDFNNYKNLVGSFSNPIAVIINEKYLNTLPPRQLLSGFGEIIKYGLIDDLTIWNKIKNVDDLAKLEVSELIIRCLNIKAKLVKEDPYENGIRKILNCGHSIGHAIESHLLTTENAMLHGEAVVIGIICEAFISYKRNLITKAFYIEIKETIIKFYGHKYKAIPSDDVLLEIIKHDKKNRGGKILLSLLRTGGKCDINIEVSKEEIISGIQDYKNI